MYRIAEIRERQHITQEELARQTGIAPAVLSAYEAGHDVLGCKATFRLAKALNVSANCILGLPEREDIIKTAKFTSISDITKVVCECSSDMVNLYLALGWTLLYVGADSKVDYQTGGTNSDVVYVLGFAGDPEDAIKPPVNCEIVEVFAKPDLF